MSRWFRHYAGMMRDEKLVRVAVKSKQPVERVVWVWGAILESAAEINDNGRYEFDAGEAAYFLRVECGEIEAIIAELGLSARLHEGVVARWGDRQYSSDGAAERQRRYRERRKDGDDRDAPNRNGDAEVTSPVTSRDGAVTLQETETETDITSANALGAASPPIDYRDLLWRQGPAFISRHTGMTHSAAKSLIGKWLKAVQDDCRLLLAKLEQAERDRVVDPVAWVTASIRPPPKKVSLGAMFRDEGRKIGILPNDPASTSDRRLETSIGGGLAPGADPARLVAFTGGG